MEAAWRVLGYDIYPPLSPSVHTIKMKTPIQMQLMSAKGQMSEFQMYLIRPAQYIDWKFKDLFREFSYKTTQPVGADVEYEEIEVSNVVGIRNRHKKYYLYRMSIPREVVRLNPVPWDAGEMWWLRLIVLNVPIIGRAENAKVVDGFTYPTYQEAAVALGLLAGTNEAEICFAEAAQEGSNGFQLRELFVALTIQGFPTIIIFNNYQESLMMGLNDRNELLTYLDRLFRLENKDMTEYGLPAAPASLSMVDRYFEALNIEESNAALNLLHHIEPNTESMTEPYTIMTSAIDNQQSEDPVQFFVIDSMAGSGKTTFAKKIFHYTKTKNKIVLGAAATGLAAQVYGFLNFETYHTLFAIPVIEDEEEFDSMENIACQTERDPERTELIDRSNVIILDEAFSAHKYCYSSVLGSYRELRGKIVLLLMDRGQTAPVVKSGDRRATVDATLLRLPLWNDIVVYTFPTNLRLAANLAANPNDPTVLAQKQYAEDLAEMRTNGPFRPTSSLQPLHEEEDSGLLHLRFKNYQHYTNMDLAINWVYSDGLMNANHADIAILTTLNKDVREWNSRIQELNPNEPHILLSSNQLADVDDERGNLRDMLNFNTLQYYEKAGVPRHELKLKVGDVCFMMRGLYKAEKLAKNTRVQIQSISKFRIVVCRLTDPSQSFNIPRIRFKITHFLGFTLLRTQFPLELAYAMSKNKSQGQGFSKCLIDIRSPVFSHGQEYVAFSRLRDVMSGAVFCDEDQIWEGDIVIANVVYRELFA